MALDAVVIPFPERAPGDASRPSFSVSDERLIRRVLAVLNTEIGCTGLGYESRARLYFYLGFQRYAALRWLSVLSVQGHGHEWQLGRRISTNLQGLMSPRILGHDAMEEPMYREMVIALSGEMFALLRLAHDQIRGRERPPVSQMGCRLRPARAPEMRSQPGAGQARSDHWDVHARPGLAPHEY